MNKQKSEIKNTAVVIGGGLSGLATAALLGKSGWQVTLVEKNKTLGGRARVLKKDGFTFDMGPSWYMMPEVFEQYFSLFGRKPSDFYELIRLNPKYKVIFGDNSSLILSDSIDANATIFENIEPGSRKKLKSFLNKMQFIYDASTQKLMSSDITDFRTWTNLANLKAVLQISSRLKFWQTWNSEIQRYFKNEKLQQILGFPAVFLGGSPFNTPSLYSILTWAVFGKGIWYPMGGMGKIVEALTSLCKLYGVHLITEQTVNSITVVSGKIKGVKTKHMTIPAEIVVAAADLHHVQTSLIDKKYQDWDSAYWQKSTLGISALLLYLGINKKISNALHHNIYFSADWKTNFEEIFEKKSLPNDPSIYISIRSVTDKSIVPHNSDEIFVLVPLGAKGKYDNMQLKSYADKIGKKVAQLLDFNFDKDLIVKEIFTPENFIKDYHSFDGTALGLAHTLDQSLWLRPTNRSKKVKGLYFAGQYTQPGVGVPMALISAEITAGMIGSPKSPTNEIFKKGSTTYYYSSLFFTGQVREDVFNLYAYVRTIDDLVDCPNPNILEFEKLYKLTQASWQGKKINNQLVNSFIALAKRKQFEWDWIQSFWQAMRSDLKKKSYKSFSELEPYIHGSAEVVGLMMAKIMDLPKTAFEYAALQGKAMQYVNFIRDVKEDEQLGRNYLGYSLQQKDQQDKWSTFIRSHIDRYREIQKNAEQGYKFIPKNLLVPIKTAAQMYDWTADYIYKNPSSVWRKIIKPSKSKVVSNILKNFVFS